MTHKTTNQPLATYFDKLKDRLHIDEAGQVDQGVASHYDSLLASFYQKSSNELQSISEFIEKTMLSLGITFNTYSGDQEIERILPMDMVPRVIPNDEWKTVEAGLVQRMAALNAFLSDVYSDQYIIKDGIIPREDIESRKGFHKVCMGFRPKNDIWCHIGGIDLIRDEHGKYVVLEDNLRCPSGVSYVLENREISKRLFSQVMSQHSIAPVSQYPTVLRDVMEFVSPGSQKVSAVLTPGIYNSAYFEHSFLAREMGIELVQSNDLVVKDDYLMMKTTSGLVPIDSLYRRVDDDFLDPLVFRSDSLLGIPGLFDVVRKGNLSLLNAIGTGVADDKLIYTYVPDMIRYYLKEEPILSNVHTYRCLNSADREYVLDHLDELVVKATGEAGGYGMLMGPQSTAAERAEFKEKICENPGGYIAQPIVNFSTAPTMVDGQLTPRHVDLRPFVLYGQTPYVLPGGLTRVALKEGSLVVNSSQGGGSKDTWVLNQ